MGTLFLVTVIFVGTMGCEDRIDSSLRLIKEEKISKIVLEWMVLKAEYTTELERIYETKDLEIINGITKAIYEIEKEKGSRWVTRRVSSIGILTFVGEDNNEYAIDITQHGFFIHGERTLDYEFYSPKLSRIIENMTNALKAQFYLFVPESIFARLSGKGE